MIILVGKRGRLAGSRGKRNQRLRQAKQESGEEGSARVMYICTTAVDGNVRTTCSSQVHANDPYIAAQCCSTERAEPGQHW